MFTSCYHHEICQTFLLVTEVMSMQKVEVKTQFSRFRTATPFEFTYGDEIMHKAWCGIEDVPYCFSVSSVKFYGHTGQKISDFYLSYVFSDWNYSLNSPMALKWCTELDVAQKRCLLVFRGLPSNFKVIQADKKINPWFETNFSKITRSVAALKSLRFALSL